LGQTVRGAPRALIMDFDGLIIDTEVPRFVSWQEQYAAHGQELTLATWMPMIGMARASFDPQAHLEMLVGHAIEREVAQARRRQRWVELVAAQSVLPGVAAYIADARRLGLRLGIASSATHPWVEGHLASRGLLGAFDCVRCAEDVAHPKPEPDLYLAVLAALGLGAEEAIALEDSPTGIAAAKRAGLFCVAVPNPLTRALALEEADVRLASLEELPLERLLQRVAFPVDIG
jgi:HAD superfamily hydrolase (TIGR01509 family)